MKSGAAFLVGLVIGSLAFWFIGDRRLTNWIAAAEIQQAQEKARVAEINERTIDGYSAAVAYLRDRLLAGERPSPPGVPARRVPKPTGPTDARPADDLDGARRAAAALGFQLADCQRDYKLIFDQTAETTLQFLHLRHWIGQVNGQH